MNPISRIPLFLLGMYAGELCLRHSEDLLPWPSALFRFFPSCFCCCNNFTNSNIRNAIPNPKERNTDETRPTYDVMDRAIWSYRATYQSSALLILTLFVWGMDTLDRYYSGGGGIKGGVWLQAIVPFAQLELIVALTRDNRTSLAFQVLHTKLGRWLGDRSMCIYLVHYPLIMYVCLAVYGKPLVWPQEFDCSKYSSGSSDRQHCDDEVRNFSDAMSMPLWGIAVVPVLTILLSDLFYRFIEEPCRKLLRVK